MQKLCHAIFVVGSYNNSLERGAFAADGPRNWLAVIDDGPGSGGVSDEIGCKYTYLLRHVGLRHWG